MKKTISILLAGLSVWLLFEYGVGWFCSLNAPLAIEYEGPCLWAAYNLSLGNNIYPVENLVQSPFVATIYTPLYFILCAPFQLLDPGNLWSLRLISMASFIAALFFLYKLFCQCQYSKAACFLGIMSFAGFFSIWSWSLKGRVDMLSIAFCAWSLQCFNRVQNNEETSYKKIFLTYSPSVLAGVLAIYTKQSSILIPVCIVLFLLLRQRFKEGITYGAYATLLSAVIFTTLHLITQGGFSSQTAFLSRMPFSGEDLLKHLSWIGVDWPKIVLALSALILCILARKDTQSHLLPVLLFLVAGGFTAYTIGTTYANVNHAFLFYLACSWLIAIFCNSIAAGGLISLIFTLPALVMITLCSSAMFSTLTSLSSTKFELEQLKPALENKLILVEDPQIAMKVGAIPEFVDIATFIQVWSRNLSEGKQPPVNISQNIKQQKYAAIVINKKDSAMSEKSYFWTPEIVRAIKENYVQKSEVMANGENQILYLPK